MGSPECGCDRDSALATLVPVIPWSTHCIKICDRHLLGTPLSGFRPTVAESDTDTLENPSIFGESEVHEDHVARDAAGPAMDVRVTAAIRLGFEGLDFVDLRDTFRVRALVMKSVLGFLKGPYRSAMRLAMREDSAAFSNRNELQSVRAWKLFLLLPHMEAEQRRFGSQGEASRTVCRIRLGRLGFLAFRRVRKPPVCSCHPTASPTHSSGFDRATS